jgi:AraC-like DNA-binding protein
MAFLYVDAASRDLAQLNAFAHTHTNRAAFDLSIETTLIEVFDALAHLRLGWSQARQSLEVLLEPSRGRTVDPRVRQTLRGLHAEPTARRSLAELAAAVYLSESRLGHLFKEETGVPLRRYKVWVAMGAAMRAIARGETLTTAALDAGFSSSAHFSATYREMFGLEPSRLARGRLAVVSPRDNSRG